MVGGRDSPRLRPVAWIAIALLYLAVAPPPAAADPVIAAAGDIACSSTTPTGSGSSARCHQRATSDLLVNAGLSAVLTLGDLQYQNGTLSSFNKSYHPTWGRVRPITFPSAGNHEYKTPDAAGYFDYFNGTGYSTGRAGDRDKGYYSFDIGTWHLIALNTSDECMLVACGEGSAQEKWLRADLAAHPAACTLAFWHDPRFNSGHSGNATFTQAMFQALYDADADVLLGGHAHDYERFAPQNPAGKLDEGRGIRQFVVGTGGGSSPRAEEASATRAATTATATSRRPRPTRRRRLRTKSHECAPRRARLWRAAPSWEHRAATSSPAHRAPTSCADSTVTTGSGAEEATTWWPAERAGTACAAATAGTRCSAAAVATCSSEAAAATCCTVTSPATCCAGRAATTASTARAAATGCSGTRGTTP
jgi:hypothetical protein